MQTENELLVFASSMTGAFEGAMQNLFSPGERIIVATNGAFGQRWVEMGQAFGLDVLEVASPWGSDLDCDRVAAAVNADPAITAAICVHCETSTGVVNNVQEFAAAAGADVLTMIDSASGLGACELRTDAWGLDVVIGGGQKALMIPPGLAFASISPRAWQRHCDAKLPRYYFDWDHALDALKSDIPRTPWTPAISLLVQLDAALRMLLAEGLEAAWHRHIVLGRVARAGIQGIGLDLLTQPRDENSPVTTARVPLGIDADYLVRQLYERYSVQIVAGSGHLTDKIIRIGHCGYVDALDVIATIAALELTLDELGVLPRPGAGVAAAVAALAMARGSAAVPPVPASSLA
jgi:aspartate aminotransferase-like enzyme